MSSSQDSAPSVPLPPRNVADATISKKPPVWSISESGPAAAPAPLPAKCDRHEPARSGVCCKELKDDDERTLVDPDVVRDVYAFLHMHYVACMDSRLMLQCYWTVGWSHRPLRVNRGTVFPRRIQTGHPRRHRRARRGCDIHGHRRFPRRSSRT